jgi:hypothetical protein
MAQEHSAAESRASTTLQREPDGSIALLAAMRLSMAVHGLVD